MVTDSHDHGQAGPLRGGPAVADELESLSKAFLHVEAVAREKIVAAVPGGRGYQS